MRCVAEIVRTPSRDVGQALVDAAERVLVRDGLAGVTVRAVATEAGVAPMGVYNRFGSKDGLVAAVLVRGFDGLTAAVTGRSDVQPAERLVSSGRGYRRFALENPRHYEAMFGTSITASERSERQSAELAEHAGASFGALVDAVAQAMRDGVLRPGDPTGTAQLIWSAVHGAVSLELAGVVRTADPAESYEQLLQLVMAGLS